MTSRRPSNHPPTHTLAPLGRAGSTLGDTEGAYSKDRGQLGPASTPNVGPASMPNTPTGEAPNMAY